MDSYSLEKILQKAVNYALGVKASNPNFYKPGRARWLHIVELGFQLVKIGLDILRVEQLNDVNPDFNASSSNLEDIVNDQVQSIVYELTKSHNISTPDIADDTNQSPEVLVEGYIRIPQPEVVQISVNFNKILERLAKTDCGIPIINQCANTLWRWYEARIIKKYNNAPEFHYDICRLKHVMYHLVIVFGYYHEKGKLDYYLTEFDKWVYRLGTSSKSHTWIGPVDVHLSEKQHGKGFANLSAVVIWDVLLDNGLMELCKMTPHNSVYPGDNRVWDIVESVNADILNPYVNYRDDGSILDSLRLIKGGGTTND